jgi:hypothetical protein
MTREIPATAAHPLVDAGGEGWVLWESRSSVIGLTAAAVNLLARSLSHGVVPILVTDATTVLTSAFAETWRGGGGAWVVRGRSGLREGFSGRRLGDVADVLTAEPVRTPDDVDLAFLEPRPAVGLELSVIVSQRHRANRATLLGGAVDGVAAILDRQVELWGAHEPAGSAWDRAAFTEYARTRMPRETLVVTAGAGLVATVVARRTKPGIEEITTLAADLGAPSTLGFEGILAALDTFFRDLGSTGMPLVGWASARPTAAPLAVPAVLQAPPTPLRLMIGAAGVKLLGLAPARFVDRFGAQIIGRPRLPALLFPLGSLGDPTWQRLDAILADMDRSKLDEALGGGLLRAASAGSRTGGVDDQP